MWSGGYKVSEIQKPSNDIIKIMSDIDSSRLSERELEILQLVATGVSNKEIAKRLSISIGTVKVHLRNIFVKMQVSSRTEATIAAIQGGLVTSIDQGINSEEPGENDDIDDQVDNQPTIFTNQQSLTGKLSGWRKYWWLLAPIGIGLFGLLIFFLLQTLPGSPFAEISETQINDTAVEEIHPEWKNNTPMLSPRGKFGSVLLEDQIFVIGGENTKGVVNVVESYDVRQNTWTSHTSKPFGVADIQASNIGGRIYVPGGRLPNGEVTDILEVYNPQTNTWERMADIPLPLSAYAAATFEGKIYLFGGWDGQSYLNTVFEYDPNEDIWTEKNSMPTARGYASAVLIEDSIHVLGGKDEQEIFTVHETYMPQLDDGDSLPWSNDVPLPEGRHSFGATSAIGLIYVVGGEGEAPTMVLPSLVFLSTNREWQSFESPIGTKIWSGSGLQFWGTDIFQFGGYLDQEPTGSNASYQVILLTILPIIEQ